MIWRSVVRVLALASWLGAFGALEVTVYTVTVTFEDDDPFAVGELAAYLEACASPATGDALRAECVRKLISPYFLCDGAGNETACVFDGVTLATPDVLFTCDETLGCPSTDDALRATLDVAVPAGGCDARGVSGFVGACYPSAWCQWTESADVTSFGRYCPSSLGVFCCANRAVADPNALAGVFTTAAATSEVADEAAHLADLSFRVTFDVAPPSLVRVVVDTPYLTSETAACPSAYAFGFQDPVERLPREEAGYPRRAATQAAWTPLTFLPAQDLVGRPRSACGNYDMTYANDADFRAKFVVGADAGGFAYGAVPAVDASVWNASVAPRDIPSGMDTWWKMGAPADGRVNYTMGYWDLVAGFYACRDYATGERLVERRVEAESAFFMGVPYRIETYSWNLHLCQIGFHGAACANASETQTYAKSCAVVPVSLTVAPQQMAAVSPDATSASLTTKAFLHSVDAVVSDCKAGSERVAVVFHLTVFDERLALAEGAVHDVRPAAMFERADSGATILDATAFATVAAFLASNPGAEGVYKLRASAVWADGRTALNQKLVALSACMFTGHDARRGTRTEPRIFADAIFSQRDVAQFDLELVLRRAETGGVEIRNAVRARVLATGGTLTLRSQIALESEAATAEQRLYGSYESAREDTGVESNDLPENVVMTGGDQLCSKHQARGTHAASVSLRPNAVGACLLTPTGVARVDAEGARLAGREIAYRAFGMLEPATFTFGCERNWIDVTNATRGADGVYELRERLQRLPDDNHERAYWFVLRADVNGEAWGTSGRPLSDAFGVGLFHYDDEANAQIAARSDRMQADPLTEAQDDEALDAGCVETRGNLRASCNLVCFTIAEGELTGAAGENATLVVHHVSVAVVADETGTETVDRFTERKRRRRTLAEVDGADDARREQTRLLTVRSRPRQTDGVNDTDAPAPPPTTTVTVTMTEEPSLVREVFVGFVVGVLVVLCVFLCACCLRCANNAWRRRKRKRRMGSATYASIP